MKNGDKQLRKEEPKLRKMEPVILDIKEVRGDYRVVTEGLLEKVQAIFKDPGQAGISCCIEGCCVSWCCIRIS